MSGPGHDAGGAAAHCGLRDDAALSVKAAWRRQCDGVGDWSAWLGQGDEPDRLDVLRRHADKRLPCGSETFIEKLEALAGRTLQYRPRGRPRKTDE